MDIDQLLRLAMDWGASDVHLVVPASPVLRVSHKLMPVGDEPMTPLAIREAFESITSEKQREVFYSELELDFA